MKKLLLSALMFLPSAYAAHGQRYFGIATSNWSANNAIYLNPANIADSRTRLSVDLFSLNVIGDNNLIRFTTENLNKAIKGDINGIFESANSGSKVNLVAPYVEVRLPGVMYSIDENNSIALTTRVRAMTQFNNFDKTFLDVITNPPTSASAPYNINSKNFNWTSQAWSEIKLTYARVVYNEGDHFVKGGLTVSRLGGVVGYLGIKGSIDAQFYPGSDSVVAKNTQIEFSSNLYDKVSDISNGISFDKIAGFSSFSQMFTRKDGGGWGADIGAVYEYRPDHSWDGNDGCNKYKVRASVAVTDIGAISYASRFAKIKANGVMSSGDIANHFLDYSSFSSYAASRGFTLDTGSTTTKVHMPTALILGADYYVMSHLYVNGTFLFNLANRNTFGNAFYNQFTITPRWDTKWFSAGLPITYNTMSGMKLGLGLRVAGFIIGSDDVIIIGRHGANVYIGGFVPITKRNKREAK